MKFLFRFTLPLICVLVQGCSGWNQKPGKPYRSDEAITGEAIFQPYFRIILAGDAGASKGITNDPLLQSLKQRADASGENAAVIFLGDNAYPAGLPPEGHKDRVAAVTALDAQMDAVRDFKGRTIFIPGNHDWNESRKGGYEYVLREEAYVENRLHDSLAFLPGQGCPGPEMLELHPGIVLITLDLEWWLSLHEKPEGPDSPCSCKSKADVLDSLRSMLARCAEKTVILAAHHPFYSNGPHGGHNGILTHLFPLTVFSKNLFVPLPVIGTLFVILRKIFPPRQDLNHPAFRKMRDDFLPILQSHENLIMVSGHEHNLQLRNESRGQVFLVSGSASKWSPLPKKRGLLFGHAGKAYVILHFIEGPDDVSYEALIPAEKKKPEMVFLYKDLFLKD